MPFDLARARRETPGCERVLHFNNAGAALMPRPVLDATVAHLELEARIGGYEAADRAHDAVERVYDAAAALLNCHRDEIAVVENATRAWDMAFYSVPLGPGDRILTATAEYASNYIAYLQVARRTGATVEAIPNDESGQLSVAALRELLDERVKLIAITHVPTNGGLVNPAAAVGQIAREAGVLYLLHACQSVGQLPLDVPALGCDPLSATPPPPPAPPPARLDALPGVTVRDLGAERCGIVTFTVDGREPEAIQRALARHDINVTTSSPAGTRLDMEARGLAGVVRASVHYYNSEEEIARFCETLAATEAGG